MIGNCGHDERGKYSGGKAGDQGGEFVIKEWYNRGWTHVIRFDSKTGKKIASVYEEMANNDHIGYDQGERLTLINELKRVRYKVDMIKKNVECDCSSSVAACVICVGELLGKNELSEINPAITTRNIRSVLSNAGAKVLTDKKYLTGEQYLKPGDILLCENHHVAIFLYKNKTEKKKENNVKSVRVVATGLNIRSGAGTQYPKIGACKTGEKLKVVETKNGWIRTEKGWISSGGGKYVRYE